MRTPFRAPNTTAELPLFVKGIAETEGLADDADVRQPEEVELPPARPPLSVRRSAPSRRVRERSPRPVAWVRSNHDLLEDLQRVEREEAIARGVDPAARLSSAAGVEPSHRAAAAAIDVGVLGGIATFVFWATLRLCNISLSGLGAGALVPLLFFLALMDLVTADVHGGRRTDDRQDAHGYPGGKASTRPACRSVARRGARCSHSSR
jgi:hypothetical protein